MASVIQIINIPGGPLTGFEGEYLVHYDPNCNGIDNLGHPLLCHVVTTPDRDQATRYDDPIGEYRKVDERMRRRLDGKMNRPLTAFSVEIEGVE